MNLLNIIKLVRRGLQEKITGTTHWDVSGNTEILAVINQICPEIVRETRCILSTVSYSTVAYQGKYDLPTGYLDFEAAYYENKKLDFRNLKDIDNLSRNWRNSPSTIPRKVYLLESEGKFGLKPVPNTVAAATTLDGTITDSSPATGGDLSITSTSGFELYDGSLIIGTEVFHYNYLDSNDCKVITRGAEGTTAASHTDLAAVTERDIKFTFILAPDNLSDDDDVPFNSLTHLVPFHRVIVWGTVAILKDEQEAADAPAWERRYLGGMNWMRKKLRYHHSYRPKLTL